MRYDARLMSAAVGADIAALCSKCGDVWHVIVAKVGEDIVKVQCKECGAYHRYRHPSKVAAKKASSARAAREPRAVVERFEAPAVAADLSRPVRPYKVSEKFEVGDRLEHPTFGTGTVEIVDGAKITVFFVSGRKVLVHAKGDAATPSPSLSRPKPFDNSGPQAGKPVTSD
jgi:hypothetical protein